MARKLVQLLTVTLLVWAFAISTSQAMRSEGEAEVVDLVPEMEDPELLGAKRGSFLGHAVKNKGRPANFNWS